MAEKKPLHKELTKGFLSENPVLRLVLGTCPTLATSTSVATALGMGISASIVLICSNIAISALRKFIPSKVRIPAYIVVIASFVTIVQMLVKAFVPALNDALGVYLPLIVVNCIILGRAEAFASKNSVVASAVDGLGMGIGFTTALFCMATVREIFGAGTFLKGIGDLLAVFGDVKFDGFTIPWLNEHPLLILVLAPGGFFVFGILMACANKVAESKGKPRAELRGCAVCPMAATCSLSECANTVKEAAE
ncbi:MAG: electron transport complex subunit E [Clostridia bacterium]|nr:electron transport complex subunit E [Clostridia bacterium]